MKPSESILTIVLFFLLGGVLGWLLRGLRPSDVPEPNTIVQTDTLWRHDTLSVPYPVPVAKWIHDTTYLAVTDTMLIHRHDTTYVQIPRETTYYKDSLYEAWVTGFRASLDSVHVFTTTEVITTTLGYKPRRWGIGVQGGVTYLPKSGVTPYVGVGVSYNIITF